MDNKNVFVAIALSMSVLLFWGAFFETPKKNSEDLKTNNQIQQKTENSITPSANQAPYINQLNIEKNFLEKILSINQIELKSKTTTLSGQFL